MIFRREFLQRGMVAGAGSLLPQALWAGSAPTAAHLSLFRLVHDTRQAASLTQTRRIGLQLLGGQQESGTLLRAVNGDVTRFWYDELQPVWRQQPVAVAGSTLPDVLFCLEQLARDHQLRVLWREEQTVAVGPPLVSWLIAGA